MTPVSPSTGSNRRYQVSALHTSKACNVISKYTAFVPVDVSKSRYLPTVVEYPNSGKAGERWGPSWGPSSPCGLGKGAEIQRSTDQRGGV